MLTNVRELLENARRQGYAIPAVRVIQLSGIRWCLEAAHQLGAPVIARCDSRYLSPKDAAEYAKIQEKRYPHAQLGLVVDGIETLEQAAEALRSGVTGLCLAGNTTQAEQIVRLAKAWNVGVEAADCQGADIVPLPSDLSEATGSSGQIFSADLSIPYDEKILLELLKAGVCQVMLDLTPSMAWITAETFADERVKTRFLLAELDKRLLQQISSEIVAVMHLLACRSRSYPPC